MGLDGEWKNPGRMYVDATASPLVYYTGTTAQPVSKFPSGDSFAGGAFKFVFTVLPGDATLNNRVDVTDLGVLATYYGTGGHNFIQGDFADGTGDVAVGDLGALSTYYTNKTNLQLDHLRNLIYADLDKNGLVDQADLTLWNDTTKPLSLRDINVDGVADGADLAILNRQLARELAFAWIGT